MSPSASASIEITVNGDTRAVPDSYALPDLLRDLEIDPETASGVAVACNESVVRRQDWDAVTFDAGDTVEVIQAQQGG